MYIPMLPIFFTFFAFIGVASSSAGQTLYNLAEIPWDPNVLMSYWENRACRFFGAFTFALASLGVNIAANSLSAANDFAALAPGYLNIRRGQMLCALFAWVLVPWKILASAGNFLNFMSAYAVFLGPIAAIMAFDFWLIKKRKYDSLAMYQPGGIYRYSAGVNWRAVVAFVVGVVPSLPGLINSVNSSINVGVGIHPYQFGWLLGFFATTLVYVTLSYLFPVPEALIEHPVYPDEVYDTQAGIIVDGLEPEDSATPTEIVHKSAC
jgi:NCS1 nucleoside transporter family